MTADLVRRTVALCRNLRGRGMMVTTAHAIDAIRALRCVGLESRERVYLALRCVLVARPEEVEIFDDAANISVTFDRGIADAVPLMRAVSV